MFIADAQVLSGLLESRRYHKSFCKLMEPIATEWVASESTDGKINYTYIIINFNYIKSNHNYNHICLQWTFVGL